MARIVLYPTIALVASTAAIIGNSPTGWDKQNLNPEIFSNPFPVSEQQFSGNLPQAVPSIPSPLWSAGSPEISFASVALGESVLPPGQGQVLPDNSPVGWDKQNLSPEVFKKPFPANEQQFNYQTIIPRAAAGAIVWNAVNPEIVIDGVVIDSGPGWPVQVVAASPAPPVASVAGVAPDVFFKPKIIRWQSFFNLPFQQYNGWVLDWPQFKAPFPVAEQQFQGLTLNVLTTVGPPAAARVWNAGWPEVILDSVTFGEEVYPTPILTTVSNTATWANSLYPEAFRKPFPVYDQQFQALGPEQVPTTFIEGFFNYELDYAFAQPFPVKEQQFQTTIYGVIFSKFPDGWRHYEWDYRFATPFPANEQQHVAYQQGIIPTPATPYGFWNIQYDYRFAKPFPVAEQQFQAWPPNNIRQLISALIPGSGDYPKITGVYPDAPWRTPAAQKPSVKPVWDRSAEPGIIEQPKAPRPTPMPPAGIFGGEGWKSTLDTSKLPTFAGLAPENAIDLAKRMQDTMDENDAISALTALLVSIKGRG
jgi:hypothetical protein